MENHAMENHAMENTAIPGVVAASSVAEAHEVEFEDLEDWDRSATPTGLRRRDRRTPLGTRSPREERVTPAAYDAISSAPPALETAADDAEGRAQCILETLRTCGPDDERPAVDALKKIGDAALGPMEREFPGLLWFHRRISHRRLPRGAEDVGSLARAIVAFGEKTVPMLRRLMEDGDVDQRFYAVLIAGDVAPRCREDSRAGLFEAVGRRMRDVDGQVADVAIHVLLTFSRDPALRPLTGGLLMQMADRSLTPAERVFAVRALGVLRCAPALQAFVDRLDDDSPAVQDAARKALRLITGEDRGSSHRRWASWARKHAKEPRERWLIEGLLHRDPNLRAIAHRELEKLTGQDFGYDPDMSRSDRKRIYRECLRWLETARVAD